MKVNPFLDERPIPKLEINLKVKIKANSSKDIYAWNRFFAYLMKKPKTKLTFITTSLLRNISVSQITYNQINDYISEEDRYQLETIKDIFDNSLPIDLKIFTLALLQVPLKYLTAN